MFAEECLDLIDILRKETEVQDERRLENVEEAVLDIRDELRAMMAPAVSSSATGLQSNPAGPGPVASTGSTTGATNVKMTDKSDSEEEKEREQNKTRRDVFNPDNIVLRLAPNSKVATPNPNALFGEDTPKIEGFLRDTWYPQRQETRPPPTNIPIRPKQATPEGDTGDALLHLMLLNHRRCMIHGWWPLRHHAVQWECVTSRDQLLKLACLLS